MAMHMKTSLGIMLLFLVLAGSLEQRAQTPSPSVWRPAAYRGLVVGKSSVAELKKILGKPERLVHSEGSSTPLMVYSVTDPVPGRLEVLTGGGKLQLLMLYPKEPPTRKDATRIFGSDFRITRYSFDECIDLGGSYPAYEDPDGPVEQIEYRERGIALATYQGQVQVIQYLAGPFGTTHSRCAQASKNKKKP
jgi:hypothetical protein